VLVDDARECPSTWTLAASWVVVFALMHLVQWSAAIPTPSGGLANPLPVSSITGHRFADMTWAEVRRGEAWRLVTATFVHFSLLHVGMNVFGLIKLGQLVEPWYGSGPFFAVCLAIGGLGNLVGGLIRQVIASGKTWMAGGRLAQAWPSWFDTGGLDGIEAAFGTPSGGGSTILLGLLGLGAVVGWRSGTRIGSFLRDQMVAILGFTALLGLVLYNLIDNYGHAGGAIVGAAFGFVHRPLLRISERSRAFRVACWAGVAAVMVACVIAAARDDRSESGFRADFTQASIRYQSAFETLGDLERISILYARNISLGIVEGEPGRELDLIALDALLKQVATAPLPSTPTPLNPDQWRTRTSGELKSALESLQTRPTTRWGATVADDLIEIAKLGRDTLDQPPTFRQVYSFVVAWRSASKAILLDRDQAQTRLVELGRQARSMR